MRNLILVYIIISSFSYSCRDLDEINIDPNRVTETHPQLLLTQNEWDVFQYNAGRGSMYAQKMVVQTDGESSGQYYKWDRWDFDAFSEMRDITKMMEEAEKINEPSYVALGKFFKAFYFLNLTLRFGDVPYSQALQGEQQETYAPPAYDAQKDVFKGILSELREANDILANENTIIAGDIIYGGDGTQWRKAINAFRLKTLMMLSQKVSDIEVDIRSEFKEIVENQPLFESIDDNAQLIFLDQQGNRYFDFNSSSYGSGLYMDSTFIQRLQVREDPRLFIYSTQTKNSEDAGLEIDDFTAYEGGDPAAPYAEVNTKAANGKVSKPNSRYYSDPTTEPIILIGFAEQQLIISEGIVRNWLTGDAEQYYNEGVKASFRFYENYAKGYGQYVTQERAVSYLDKPVNDFKTATTMEEKIEKIIMQKYLRAFLQSPWWPYYDHLRTGYPDFRRPPGVDIPYRWIYPQNEYDVNTDNVSLAIENQFGTGNDKISAVPWWVK